jgi:hypothetical protein
MVVDQLNGKFGGQAAAAASGLGQIEQLKNTLGDLAETVGEILTPYISFFVGMLKNFVISLQNGSSFVDGMKASVYGLAVSFSFLKNLVLGLVEVISTGMAAAFESISLMTQGQFSKAKEMAALGMDEIGNVIKERQASFDGEMKALDEAEAQYQEQKLLKEEQMIAASLERKEEIKKSSNASIFTAEQLHSAKILGIELKNAEDLKKLDAAKIQARKDTLSTMSGLQDSNNKTMAAASKAFAAYEIAVSTPPAIAKALQAYPPPFSFVAAGLVAAAMAKQVAALGGVKLAEGGIVKATPGGVNAIIGEGGRDEAVIPLEDGKVPGMGGMTINFNGPIMGNESQAMELARAIDKSLLKLRQSNQSVAFEEDIF